MKKQVLTAAIVLSFGLSAFAQQDEGALRRGILRQTPNDLTTPSIPSLHGDNQDVSSDAPLGSGIAVLVGLGAAYMVGKKRKED